MNTKITIEELCQTESGTLTGGFVNLGTPIEEDAIVNRNCSDTSGWINNNCGCNACQSAVIA